MNRRKSKHRGNQPVMSRDKQGRVISGENGRPKVAAVKKGSRAFRKTKNESKECTTRLMTAEERERYGLASLTDKPDV